MHSERSLVPAVCFFCAVLSAPVMADVVSFDTNQLIDLRPEGSRLFIDEDSSSFETSTQAVAPDDASAPDEEQTSRIPEPSSMVLLGLAGGASLAARALRRARNRQSTEIAH